MRRSSVRWRWLLVLASLGIVFSTSMDSCMAEFFRDLADDLDQTAYELDGQPQTLDQWWDGLWSGDNGGGSDKDDDFEDWWEDLWD